MRLRKRTFLFGMALMMMVVISGCASGANAPTNPPPTQSVSTGSTPEAIPTVSSSDNVVVVVKTATATVGKKSETILTDMNGRTLYYFTSDVFHQVACTTGCIDTWSPLLFKGAGTATAAAKLPGDLTTETTPNGNQVAYNGHYLYTYSGDLASGDVKGDGVGNKWYVATPDLPQNQSNSQTTTGY
jgi:predicted lipoprotein with Yx(FWY)xxD motif